MDKSNKETKILSKSEEKKLKKEKKLFEAAYELFTTKGINNTAISDIVKKAGVAKGTFYLYFKDKYDIIDIIILKKSSIVLKEALIEVSNNKFESFSEGVIFFVDYIIEYLRKDKKLLKLIHKNLSWGIYRRAFMKPHHYEEMKELVSIFMEKIIDDDMSMDEAQKTLFMILELTSSVVYSSIILQEPDSIDNMKPILFKTIRKILSK